MIDIKRIRKEPEEVAGLLALRGDYPLDRVLELDAKRREALAATEELKSRQNAASKKLPQMKKEGQDTTALMAEMKQAAGKAKELDAIVGECDAALQDLLLSFPNLPNKDIAVGKDDSENREVRKVGTPREFSFDPKAHWDIGVDLGILDFERATKIAGARFSMWIGQGAALERAITSFMLSVHTGEGRGSTEIVPPLMVNRRSMTGTGQLPKFEEDAFNIRNNDFFLVPTAEVPLTNFYRDEILSEDDLPIRLTAYTPCFRAEAGSAGRDTRGLIRNHQFDKVELVWFARPEDSYGNLETLTGHAEDILKRLGLAYRVVELCTGDLGFSSAKTYDLEVWMPSYNRYVEISSCSNFEDFQARRANIRYRDKKGNLSFVHTLNGSALAVGRTFAAILENFQNEDGSVTIPEVLRPFLGGVEVIR
jgi:seryl-tRNA synthetase